MSLGLCQHSRWELGMANVWQRDRKSWGQQKHMLVGLSPLTALQKCSVRTSLGFITFMNWSYAKMLWEQSQAACSTHLALAEHSWGACEQATLTRAMQTREAPLVCRGSKAINWVKARVTSTWLVCEGTEQLKRRSGNILRLCFACA